MLKSIPALAAGALAIFCGAASAAPPAAIRVNQLGYLPSASKVAVLCSRDGVLPPAFEVRNAQGARVLGPSKISAMGAFGPCAATARLDFSKVKQPGTYTIAAGDVPTVTVRISDDVYRGVADTLLYYMREQRSRFNPLFKDSVHMHRDAILVDHPRAGSFIDVAGGWADAADLLQYVTTSAHATYALLAAFRDHETIFRDNFDQNGLAGANRQPDVLDEARHGLEWLVRMHPSDDLLLNQLGDDRDHAYLDLPPTDSSDYGWGRGGYRPVYPCTGKPQGLGRYRNKADGLGSTAGKMTAAFALGARIFAERDPAFSRVLAAKAASAYALGRKYPGACPTASVVSPYTYEEANWVDDMELGAAELHLLTGEAHYLDEALEYAAKEPVTPWMGRDTAAHYQFYPWYNPGHYAVWTKADKDGRKLMQDYYRRGLQLVADRGAGNGFLNGIPFIWCSNDLLASWATQAILYRRMSGDERFRAYENAAVDWIFGANPWGTSMVIGYPGNGADVPVDPHSVISRQLGVWTQLGGLVDGPVYRSIFQNLKGLTLYEPDEYADWNGGHIVYHDDWGDYSTNEPIMDGTAVLIYLMAGVQGPQRR